MTQPVRICQWPLLGAALALLAACGNGDPATDTTVPSTGEQAPMNGFHAESAALPEGFPASFPTPAPGAVVDSANVFTGPAAGPNDGPYFVVNLIAPGDVPHRLVDYYTKALPAAGWKIVAQRDHEPTIRGMVLNASLIIEHEGWRGEIMLITVDDPNDPRGPIASATIHLRPK